jgi:hypothetical protein
MLHHIRNAALTLLVFVAAGRAEQSAGDPSPLATGVNQDGASSASDLLQEKREQVSQLQAEIRALEEQTGEYARVLLHCRFIEADPSIVQALGLDWDADDGTQPPLSAVVNSPELEEVIEALRRRGDGRTLAEPSVITTSGRSASIFSGGEFPVFVPGENENRVEWREFGHRVELLPTVLGGGRLQIDARPQYSERDFTRAVEIDGQVIPRLHVQRIRTRFELDFDQSGIVLMRTRSAAASAECQREEAADADATPRIVLFAVTAEPVRSGE